MNEEIINGIDKANRAIATIDSQLVAYETQLRRVGTNRVLSKEIKKLKKQRTDHVKQIKRFHRLQKDIDKMRAKASRKADFKKNR